MKNHNIDTKTYPIFLTLPSTLLVILMWPNSLFAGDIGKRIATILMILFFTFLTLHSAKNIKVRFNVVLFSFWSLIFYLTIRNIIYFLDGNSVTRDFAEIIRIFGIAIFFLLGQRFDTHASRILNINYLYALIVLLFFLISIWFILGSSSLPIYNMYITRGARFSGLMASVNYSWASLIIILGLFFWYYIRNLDKQMPKKIKLSFLIASIFLFLQLILSGSRTSILAIICSIIIFLLLNIKWRILKFIILFVITLTVLFHFYGNEINNFITFGFGDDTISRFIQLFQILIVIDIDLLLQIHSVSDRLIMWQESWNIILNRIYFGHGPSKMGWSILDNTYLMTLYRYGAVGLFLELFFYMTLLITCIRKYREDWVPLVLILYITAYLVAGMASSVFYELKVPYILAILAGSKKT